MSKEILLSTIIPYNNKENTSLIDTILTTTQLSSITKSTNNNNVISPTTIKRIIEDEENLSSNTTEILDNILKNNINNQSIIEEQFNNITTTIKSTFNDEILFNITDNFNDNIDDDVTTKNFITTTVKPFNSSNITDYIDINNTFFNDTFITSTTTKRSNIYHRNNILEEYPFLVYVLLITIIIIFSLFLFIVISFLYSNRRRIIRQERDNGPLSEYGNPTKRKNILFHIFCSCCCGSSDKKDEYGNLERQISASNLAPYRRQPLPPIDKNSNDDGFQGSYVGDGRQRLRPIQMLDPAVYGTLENDNSRRSTINNPSYKSTTLTTNTSTIGTNQGRKKLNDKNEREL